MKKIPLFFLALLVLSGGWPAEDYHQGYLQKHKGGYTCHYIR